MCGISGQIWSPGEHADRFLEVYQDMPNVLSHAYAEWGGECVDRLNGIYAFAVWEKHSGRLFPARDRIPVTDKTL